MTVYTKDDRIFGVRFPTVAEYYRLKRIRTACRTHTASYQMAKLSPFLKSKAGLSMKLRAHLYLVLRCWVKTPLIHVFKACSFIKQRGKTLAQGRLLFMWTMQQVDKFSSLHLHIHLVKNVGSVDCNGLLECTFYTTSQIIYREQLYKVT